MTKEAIERGYELLKELERIKERIETLDDLIGYERERIEEGERGGVIQYDTRGRIETPVAVYPEGTNFKFETISIVELLKTEKVRLSCEMSRLEEELKAL